MVSASVSDTESCTDRFAALGSSIALLLGKAGVGGFKLCDNDILTPSNASRHVGESVTSVL